MTREALTRQIHHIQDEVLLLGSMVEQAMLQAVQALRNRDVPAANRIYRDDSYINDKRYAIENAILILIATQQPMARDLRLLAAMLEVINELERMGDYAKGVAKIARKIDGEDLPIPAEFDRMAQLAVEMLHRAFPLPVVPSGQTRSGWEGPLHQFFGQFWQPLWHNHPSAPIH